MNDVTTVRFYHRLDPATGDKLVLTNWLFGMPLYAFYVFRIEVFAPDDIKGVLMTPPFDILGPYENFKQAKAELDKQIDLTDNVSTNP